jgi:hypothetical protein
VGRRALRARRRPTDLLQFTALSHCTRHDGGGRAAIALCSMAARPLIPYCAGPQLNGVVGYVGTIKVEAGIKWLRTKNQASPY